MVFNSLRTGTRRFIMGHFGIQSVDPVYLSGIVLSLGAAILWAVHNVAIRLGTVRGRVSDAIVVVMVTNVVVIGPAAVVVHHPSYTLPWQSALAFGAAGIAGLMLGRIFLFEGIRAVGASRTTPIVSASALVSSLLAVQFLDETLTLAHGMGIVLIVVGIATISWSTATDAGQKPSLREAWLALGLPLGAAFFIGVEPIFVRTGLDRGTPILVGLTVMSATALFSYLTYKRLVGDAVRFPVRRIWTRWYLIAGLASTVGLLSYFAALAAAPVVVVIPIIQLSPLFVLAISFAFLSRDLERVTWRLAVAASVVVAGAILVSLAG